MADDNIIDLTDKLKGRAGDGGEQPGASFTGVDGDADDGCSGGGNLRAGKTQSDRLLDLALVADLFHTPAGEAYGDFEVNGHRETWPVKSRGFRRWLSKIYFDDVRRAPNSDTVQKALDTLEARAMFDAPQRSVCLRVGGLDGKIHLDLGDETWTAIEIDASGWHIVDRPPVRFRRSSGMLPLPMPMMGGDVATLSSFLNLATDADFELLVAWLVTALRNIGPYPLLVLSGEQGSAKSTFSSMVRSLVDPNSAPLRALPREERELFIAACNAHCLCFDNLSNIPAWLSDALCRLSTGGGFSARQLYSDADEVLLDAVRPIVLNGIEDLVSKPDLGDRSLFLTLPQIPEGKRQSGAALLAAFEAERPRILGALLTMVSSGIRRLPEVRLPALPRLADFALWSSACEPEAKAGTFARCYARNLAEANDVVVESSLVASAVRSLMATVDSWSGTPSRLLEVLREEVGDAVAKSRGWPADPTRLSGQLRKVQPALRRAGIECVLDVREPYGGRNKARFIVLRGLSK